MLTYLFYDIETTGLNPAFDQILQFAAKRVDSEFNEIERINIRVALSPDVIPNPNALLVNRIHPSKLSEGMSEYDAVLKIYEMMNQPGTISIGYNTLGFDDEFLRFAFFKHLLPPYWHYVKNDCHRMDLYPMVLLTHHFDLKLLRFPKLNGKISFKLEQLAHENNLSSGDSHDALVDVLNTFAIARILKSHPQFWEMAMSLFDKKRDEAFLTTPGVKCKINHEFYLQGFMMECKPLAPLIPVLFLGKHTIYKNQSRWLRLDKIVFDVDSLDDLLNQIEVIRKKDGEPPFLFSYDDVQCNPKLGNIRRVVVENNLTFLKANPDIFLRIQQYALNKKYSENNTYDVNAALYKLPFSTPNEESLFRKFHLIDKNRKGEVLQEMPQFAHRVLAIRLLGRHLPEALSMDEKEDYEAYLRMVFSSTPDNALLDHRGEKKLTLTEALSEIEKLLISKKEASEQEMLHALKHWYQQCGTRRRQRSELEYGFFDTLSASHRNDNVTTETVNNGVRYE